jgi:xanthine dehydrogenase molybdopterin-binding subunit B
VSQRTYTKAPGRDGICLEFFRFLRIYQGGTVVTIEPDVRVWLDHGTTEVGHSGVHTEYRQSHHTLRL